MSIRTLAEAGRAVDLDHALVSWSSLSGKRPTFGVYAVDFLRGRGIEVREVDSPSNGAQLAALLGVFASPYIEQSVVLSVEEIADLLAALAERDLRWLPGENGECGALVEGAAEPPDLHVVFDAYRAAWQRDDERAHDDGDPCEHWFGPNGSRRAWAGLQRTHDPLTPDGGIAPTTPRDQP